VAVCHINVTSNILGSMHNSVANLVYNHGLTQLVNEPTRVDNILDIILCSDTLYCDNIKCLPPLGSSDHSIVLLTLALSLLVANDNALVLSRPNFNLQLTGTHYIFI
jgi:hypothetical protein